MSILTLYLIAGRGIDSSQIGQVDGEIEFDDTIVSTPTPMGVGGGTETKPQSETVRKKADAEHRPKVKVGGKMVFYRWELEGSSNSIPVGTQMLGVLASSIDTRYLESPVRIELNRGFIYKRTRFLPPKTVLFGVLRYPGDEEDVYISLNGGVLPNGSQFSLNAEVLSFETMGPGIRGTFHGTFTDRARKSLALGFVSGIAETLQEKQGWGRENIPTTRSTVKNAMLSGVSRVAEQELERQRRHVESEKPYVTIAPGKKLVVSLLHPFSRRDDK